jgi:cellobiose phosphorylase
VLSTTVFAAGIFGSQTTIGNTAYNKILSGNRNALFLVKSIGTRIFVNEESTGKLYLLEVPSAFETGLGYARWIYKYSEILIIVLVWTSSKHPTCYLSIESSKRATFTLSYNIVLGSGEGETRGTTTLHHHNGGATLTPETGGQINYTYPSARFHILARDPKKVAELGTDTLLFEDGKGRNLPFFTVRTHACKTFSAALTGSLTKFSRVETFFDQRRASWERFNIKVPPCYPVSSIPVLESTRKPAEAKRLNEMMPWFIHNATIHLSVPRGLEQYTAAAWGTRDVCQGPVELLLPLRRFMEVREIILKLYSHQFLETGDWPQWFMFDRYHKIQAQDSHGDVFIWPLKALCDYIETSNDFSILEAEVPYTNLDDREYTRAKHPMLHHIQQQIDAFKKACVHGTSLLKFGHGDWEDTLQPADPVWRDILVSSWSVELLYQTLRRWSTICARAGLKDAFRSTTQFITKIRHDFAKYLMKDGVVAGLLLMSERKKFLLHPSDKLTGAHYRLIPMTRGIISEIFTPEEAAKHAKLIHKHLLFPDGVRLTNSPLTYNNGLSKYFKRAETSAFFGREVGMMYVHAHLRYVEAMAKLGFAEEAWRGLSVVNPVLLARIVKNAEPRQSNMYFSSTDADFPTRPEANRDFARIRAEAVGLKGGWRLYSSGPGLFVKQLFHECIGIRDYFEHIVFDPVLPINLGRLSVLIEYEQRKLKIIITPFCRRTARTIPRVSVNGKMVTETTELPNPYRVGATGLIRERFLQLLRHNTINIIEIKP